MKIGTLTMHHSQNYGGLLQTYALQKVLCDLGHDAEVIDYRYPAMEESMQASPKLLWSSGLRGLAGSALRFVPKLYETSPPRIDRSLQFLASHVPLSAGTYRSLDEIAEISRDYEAYITGSDQVWHPNIISQFPPYGLGFVSNERKRISYAPSLAVSSLTEKQKAFFERMLDEFDAISVRESDAVSLLSSLTKKEVKQVLDPALLLDGQHWLNLAEADTRDNSYILCYFIGRYGRAVPFMKRLSNQLRVPLVKASRSWSDLMDGHRMEIVADAGPLEFLKLLAGSTWFVTNSFHGVALSILMKKRFTAIVGTTKIRKNMGSRIHSLLNMLNMESALYEPGETFIEPKFDFDGIDSTLSSYREDSISFLSEALSM